MYKEIVTSINDFGKTKLAPSKVCNGVGVFSITEIPKHFVLFQDVSTDTIHIPFTEIHDNRVKQYLSCTCNSDSVGIYLSRTYNNINMSYYVNHSETPNVYHDLHLDEFVTLRDILPGEELTCLYTKEEIDWLT
jgi:SET domain-containing protein